VFNCSDPRFYRGFFYDKKELMWDWDGNPNNVWLYFYWGITWKPNIIPHGTDLETGEKKNLE
jgi:hypothetical protein